MSMARAFGARLRINYIRVAGTLLAAFFGDSVIGRATRDAIANAKMSALRKTLSVCGRDVTIQFPITISGPSSVEIGSNVSLAAYVHIWGEGGVRLGDRVMVGAHTAISSLTHDYTAEVMAYTLVMCPVIVENDVWIGSNCVILPGVRIGEGAVIGAGAVVTRNVEAYQIVAGVPAREISRRRRPKDIVC